MPTRIPLSLIILTKGTPLSECWYSVSWKKMTPPMQPLMRSSALKRICRYFLRFSSVFSTPTWASRLAMLPAVNMLYVMCTQEMNVHHLDWTVLIRDRTNVSCTFKEKKETKSSTDPQTHLQPGCPSLEKLCVEQSHVAPSSAPRRAWATGASS